MAKHCEDIIENQMVVENTETKVIIGILWKMWKKPNVYPTYM